MSELRDPTTATRRGFLKAGAALGGVAVFGFDLSVAAQSAPPSTEPAVFNAWIAVRPDNVVVLQVSQAEMGQGIHTTFPAIIAEEMDADWDRVVLELAPLDPAYFNPTFPQMFTGNAESVRSFWPILRHAGASVREMMRRAAAERWGVEPSSCRTAASLVHHDADGRAASYAELAADAAKLTPPQAPPFKEPGTWTLLRRSLPRRDLREKVTGAPVFGLDAARDGMVHAAIRHADTPNGTVFRIDRDSIADVRGVLDVVELLGAVAVVATSTWPALKGAAQLDVTFTPGPRDDFSSETLDTLYAETLDGDAFTEAEAHGDAAAVLAEAAREDVFEADYHSAWQAHATMEPMNCIADVRDGKAFILAPTQGQTVVAHRVSEALGIPLEAVEVERTFLGGGFGRRLMGDYAVEAALVSKAMGKPAQIVWSRPEDIRGDHFRPHSRNRLKAAIGPDGLPVALDIKIVSPTILSPVVAEPTHIVYPALDPSCLEGTIEDGFLYGIPDRHVAAHILDVPVKTMVWRTTGYGPNVFAIESFVDELAARAGADPLDYRIALFRRTIEDEPSTEDGGYADNNMDGEEGRRGFAKRAVAVLEQLRERAAWGSPIGQAQGMAISHCFETIIAQVVDVSVEDDGTLDIHKVTTVLDGGYVLDPNITQANIEGGVYWGLTQALSSEITFENGRAREANFDDFTILALPEAPPTELHWIDSGAHPGGLGEVGPVATAPALANAIAAATGRRLRTLPLSRHGIHTRYRKRFLPPARDLTKPRA